MARQHGLTPNDDTPLYFSFTTGHRAGGYGLGIADASAGVPGNITPRDYDAEHVLAWEFGYKGTLLDGQMQLNAAVYSYDYENYQDQLSLYDPLQDDFLDVPTNTGDAINSGFEVDVTWLATDALTLNANYSYTDAEYQNDFIVGFEDDPTAPVPLFGTIEYNVKGNNLKRIPTHKATAWGSYQWNLPSGRLVARASISYTGDYYMAQIERGLDRVPERGRSDASVTWSNLEAKVRVRAFVDNLTDAPNLRGISTGSHNDFHRTTGTLLYPRYFGVDVRWLFGS